jgi:hypothetical protein
MSNRVSVRSFPGLHLSDKALTVNVGVNRHDLEKDISQSFCIGTFWETTTPSQSLTLNVHETTLNEDSRPSISQGLDQVLIAINCGAFGLHGSVYQSRTDALHISRTFGNVVGIVNNTRTLSVHYSEDSSTTFEKCAIENQVASI